MTTSDQAIPSGKTYNQKSSKKITWLKRVATLFFFILVPTLLFFLIKNIEWQEVKQALRSYELTTLLMGLGIALCSYCVFASYDLIGKKYTGHSVPPWKIIPLGFVCYAFNLNLSTWVGGIGMRFRLYSRFGLDISTITKILTMSWLSNWLGYLIVAGSIFSFKLVALPDNWKIGANALQIVGFVLLTIAAFYLLSCKYAKRRSMHVFGHKITLPGFRMALVQAGLAMVNWSLMGLLIFTLLPDNKVDYTTVLGILLICSIAGVIAHIPAGLGVLETIFITLLQHQLPKSTVLAALIGYRIIYFLIPLAIALIIYLVLESNAKKSKSDSNEQQ